MKFFHYILIIYFILVPNFVLGEVSITEIMYDLEGSDSGMEWVEIYNSGPDSITIGDWHLYENETHHGLYPENFTTLGSGEYALIVQDRAKVSALYGSQKFIKSSFSLSNEGESLSLSDIDKNIKATMVYDNGQGAQGDGQSLQLISGSLVASDPTPGQTNVLSGTTNGNQDSSSENSSSNSKNSSNTSSITPEQEYITGYLEFPDQILQYSPVSIEAYVIHTRGSKTTKRLRGFHTLNFGDGTIVETDRRVDQDHVYEYPGKYQVVFEYYTSILAHDLGEEPDIVLRKTIQVLEPQLTISDIDVTYGITIHNPLNQDINLEDWNISVGNQVYTFPKYSFISANSDITIPKKVHKLPILKYGDWILLRNDENRTIYSYNKDSRKLNRAQGNLNNDVVSDVISGMAVINSVPEENDDPDEFLDRYLDQHPQRKEIFFDNQNMIDENAESKESPLESMAIGAGLMVLCIGIIRLRNYSKDISHHTEEEDEIGDIELIE